MCDFIALTRCCKLISFFYIYLIIVPIASKRIFHCMPAAGFQRICCDLRSQYSTLVRNTVVRATFKVNGKPPIWGSRSPLTPWPIDLKFDTDDYVGNMTPHARVGPAKGWNVKVKCGYFLFLLNVKKTYQFTTPCKSDEVTHPKQHKSFFLG